MLDVYGKSQCVVLGEILHVNRNNYHCAAYVDLHYIVVVIITFHCISDFNNTFSVRKDFSVDYHFMITVAISFIINIQGHSKERKFGCGWNVLVNFVDSLLSINCTLLIK